MAAPSTRRSPPPGRAANAATYLPLPAALRGPPRPPEGGHSCPADTELAARFSANVRRHGSRSRTARSARARRRPSASTKRLPASLRPTTRRKRSFRGKGLRRAYTVYRLNLPSQLSNCPKTVAVFPTDDLPPLPCRPLGVGSAPPKNRERSFRRRRMICRHACACRQYVPIPRPLSATRKSGVRKDFCA